MPKEIDDTVSPKPKVTRPRRVRASSIKPSGEGEETPKPRQRTTRRVAAPAATDEAKMQSEPIRKAPTRDLSRVNQGGIKISRQWYVLAVLLLSILGGSAYIGLQDQGAINVDALMVKERQALIAAEEERQRILREASQAAVIEALTETASSTATSTEGVESATSTEEVIDTEATSTAPVEEAVPQVDSGDTTNDQP